MVQVSFRIDAASYVRFLRHTPVAIRDEGHSGTVVVTCDQGEVEFLPHRGSNEAGPFWMAERKGKIK
jgi:hypothetical protein